MARARAALRLSERQHRRRLLTHCCHCWKRWRRGENLRGWSIASAAVFVGAAAAAAALSPPNEQLTAACAASAPAGAAPTPKSCWLLFVTALGTHGILSLVYQVPTVVHHQNQLLGNVHERLASSHSWEKSCCKLCRLTKLSSEPRLNHQPQTTRLKSYLRC